MTETQDFIEIRIINAVRALLSGQANELLKKTQFHIPIIEFGGSGCGSVISPVIALSSCERTEKERVIRLDAYTLTITFTSVDTPESELYCYAYSGAISRAVYDNPTLGGCVSRAAISGKKYVPPKMPHCGEGWSLVITLRLTTEAI